MTNKIVKQATKAKELGYTHIAAVVKSLFNTEYYNINSCDEVIAKGKWIALPGAKRNKLGTIASSIDWTKTVRKRSISYVTKI